MVIAPNWGGQIDFLNKTNALLVEGKEVRAPKESMYWESKPNAIWFQPDTNDAAEKLKFAYHNFEEINHSVENQKNNILQEYDWCNITNKIINL